MKREKRDKKIRIILFSFLTVLILAISLICIYKRIVITRKSESSLSKLYTLPYLSDYHKAPKKDSITQFNPIKAYAGLNLYNSAHAPSAFLMNMNGKQLYRWHFKFKDAFPDFEDIDVWYNQIHWRYYWRRVYLFNNGDLLALYEGNGLIKIDKHSNLIWATKGGFHHDFEVVDDKIYALNRKLITLPRINQKGPILEGLITILNADGEIIKNISILELFDHSEFTHLMEDMPPAGDVFHTNTIEILDGKFAHKSPIFKKGNALLSMRMLDTIAIADLEESKIVWAKKPGIWKTQHQPKMLDNGNMDEFFSLASGSNQRLPNGNTLITESDRGRVFEVTPESEIVWEYINTHRTGEKKDKIAAIFEMIRFQPDSDFFLKLKKQTKPSARSVVNKK